MALYLAHIYKPTMNGTTIHGSHSLCANFSNVKYGATNILAYLSFIPATGAPCVYIKLGKLKVDGVSEEVNLILCF